MATAAAGGGGGGGGVFGRLRQQGLELCVWVFKHAGRHQLRAMGPTVLQVRGLRGLKRCVYVYVCVVVDTSPN